ncbi:MAG TPA: bifunctional YncE family protein/alkaline phosphatase family protein [Vicinamibacterales bacterium]|nr:bifunctional YncE family protein/alkaline phosphatase family protein [Vicinamibacterales bacterium]
MSTRLSTAAVAVGLLIATSAAVVVSQRVTATKDRPGYLGGGVTLLPNGWRISPAGRHFSIGDLPLAMTLSPDGHALVVTNNGYQRPSLKVFDLDRETSATVTMDDAWLGLAWHPDGKRVFSSGAASNTVLELGWDGARLRAGRKINVAKTVAPVAAGATRPPTAQQTFVGGIAVSADGERLYAAHVYGQFVSMVDVATGALLASADLPAEPYTALLSHDDATLFVSVWGGARVLTFDAKTLAPKASIDVGEHPNAMALSPDGRRLFVACANTNAVWAIDLAAGRATEQISTALFPKAPPGSTPNSVAVSPDGSRLLVANADNNAVAFVDISSPGSSRVLGFIPTGWYPTGVLFSRDATQIFVLSGKGLASMPNVRGPQPGLGRGEGQYIGSSLEGSLSILPTPDAAALAQYTKKVYDLTPYTDEARLAPGSTAGSPIPARVGDASPIKHVFYVIRENRTYDQILGDLDRGNGDPSLALFGENTTPNAHALAREFVTFDNFYVNAEVSYAGHAFSTGAYSNDFVEKIWPTNYGGRGATYLSEGGGTMRTPYGNIAAPPNGYIWDAVVRANRTVRSYGEFAARARAGAPESEPSTAARAVQRGEMIATVPGLEGRVHPSFPGFDLSITDNHRVDIWLEEFKAFESNGQLPALSIIRLGNDHTNGTRAGSPTPRAMIAENDLALGRLVEAISRSVYWKDSAIFVVEDDAQDGPDHVDAHRSVVLVISPYARRGVVDSTLYTTSGVLRTMELILGAEPMTQYDAAATPMHAAFQRTPVMTPYARKDARIPLDERNRASAPGAAASARMDFDEADVTPMLELNEILWQSVHGAGARMPPPVHAAFVRPTLERDTDDEPAGANQKSKVRSPK